MKSGAFSFAIIFFFCREFSLFYYLVIEKPLRFSSNIFHPVSMTPSPATLFSTSHSSYYVIWVFWCLSRPGYDRGHMKRMTKIASVLCQPHQNLVPWESPVKQPFFSMTIACAHRQAPQIPPGWYCGCLLHHLLLRTMVSAAVLIENHVRCNRQNSHETMRRDTPSRRKNSISAIFCVTVKISYSLRVPYLMGIFHKIKYSCYLDKKHLLKAVFIRDLFAN